MSLSVKVKVHRVDYKNSLEYIICNIIAYCILHIAMNSNLIKYLEIGI